MTFFMKIQTLTLVLLLLGATCIAPVMAGSPKYITEDGVHLTKYADSPTQLDPNYYRLNSADDVVVDGDQYYWVRVGNVKAEGLSKNVYANLACKGFVVFGAAGVVYVATPVILAGGGITLTIGATTFTASPAAIAALFTAIGGFTSDQLTNVCETVETWFVNNKYQVVASDGTILLGIKKDNTAGIQELKKDGIDIEKLTHLSKDGRKTDL
jgi:hypothetical protein